MNMNAKNFTRRLLTLALAVGPVACAHTPAMAQDKDAPTKTPEPPKPPQPPSKPPKSPPRTGYSTGGSGAYSSSDPYAEQRRADVLAAKEEARYAEGQARAAQSRTVAGMPPIMRNMFTIQAVTEGATIIATDPMDAAAQAEWREDLGVMDKLLRQAVTGSELDVAMGIMVKTSRIAPMYIEGAGVVLGTGVPWPLAPGAGKDADSATGKPPERPSAWERTRRELKGEPAPETWGAANHPAFDQAKVDSLVGAILKTLPEATNFRHLKPDESVFITVGGIDGDGTPVRLTLKAKKSDIDAAAKGTLEPEAFKQRVARRIG